MRADRLGSYSIARTLAGMPVLSRRQSMIRYLRLCPPPRCRTVIRPWLFRPDFRFSGSVSDFSGLRLVISSKVETLIPRRPGVVGLYFQPAILTSRKQSNPLPPAHPPDAFLPRRGH